MTADHANDALHTVAQRAAAVLLSVMGLASLIAAELTLAGVLA